MSPDADVQHLSLYQYPQCPYCRNVLRVIERLGLNIELRNTLLEPGYERELREATGRRTVPCLRIVHGDGRVQWMHESYDIIDYLEDRFGAARA